MCGSPRKEGNTAFLLGEIVSRLKGMGISAECLMLIDLRIGLCDGCLRCEVTDCTGDCSIDDDMGRLVVPKLMDADALIIGTPSYFDLPTALVKNFMDRTNMILGRLTEKALPCGIVVVGQSDMESLNTACEAVRRYCRICEMQEVEHSPVAAVARDCGDVRGDSDAVGKARELADSVAAVLRLRQDDK